MLRARQRLQRLSVAHVLARLRDTVSLRHQRIDDLRQRLSAALLTQQARRLRSRGMRVASLETRLRRHDPSIRIALANRRLTSASDCLERLSREIFAKRRALLDRASLRLEALSPLAVLNRGYAIVYAESGAILRDAADAPLNSFIEARLGEGTLRARVTAPPDRTA